MNKPVAWMQIHYKDKMCVTKLSPVKTWEDDIPLYTNPVKEQDCYGDGNVYRGVRSKDSEIPTIHFNPVKELDEPNWKEMYWEMHELNHKHWSELKDHTKKLTDEEIDFIFFDLPSGHSIQEFARAILRKAQEK